MSTFHDEIAGRLERHLIERRVVVFYDPRREFIAFIEEAQRRSDEVASLRLAESTASFSRFSGSYLKLRHEVEARAGLGPSECALVYVPGEERDRKRSALMELDLAGASYEPQLRKLARDILRQRFSDGQIDELLDAPGVGYVEIASFFDGGTDQPSVLRTIFGSMDSEALLARWILDPDRDSDVLEKGARPELFMLIASRVGMEMNELTKPEAARRELVRYLLVNEFRMDLGGPGPEALELIRSPSTRDERDRIRTVVSELRRVDSALYTKLADEVEVDLGLAGLSIEVSRLGATDTFRFEESRLLEEAARLLEAGEHAAALALAEGREDSHWVRMAPRRLAQWSVCRQAAILGTRIAACRKESESLGGKPPREWIGRYTAPGGWAEVDGLDRRLGAFLSGMDEEPVAARGVSRVRTAYAEWVRSLTEGYVTTLERARWDTGWDLHQSRIFDEYVKPGPDRVALIVVDAFRYEMGRELAERLNQAQRTELEAAVAAVPTITSVGMAALLPGASTSFSVRKSAAGVAGAINDSVLPDWPARWKHLQAKVPGAVEIRLEVVLQRTPKALASEVKGAKVVLVRSQDIDAVGEAGVGLLAQQAMANVIPNLARAIHRLRQAGISRFIVTADHGHLLDVLQDDDMKIDAPGGDSVELHRRCWAGRGGKTPPGAVRVSGADLGYETDLEFVFPRGRGVFLSGGDLRYHHGGLSLQELVVPVLRLTMAEALEEPDPKARVRLLDVPDRITNRTLGVRVELAADLFAEPHGVRVVLLHEAEQVGEAGMVQGAVLDPRTKRIELIPGQPANVGLMLTRDDCATVKLVVLDAESEAVLAQSRNLNVDLTI